MNADESPLIVDEDAKVVLGSRSVAPKALPFLVLLVIFAVVVGTLVALSFFVGGCNSDPVQCFEGALSLPATFPVSDWLRVSSNLLVRRSEERYPAFLLPLLVTSDLLGTARLFSIGEVASMLTATGNGNTSNGEANFNLTSNATWLGAGQVTGQFSRIGVGCECQAANRSILGASALSLSRFPNGTVNGVVFSADVDGGNSAVDVVNATDVAAALGVSESTHARAQPTAYLRTPKTDYLFVDVFTQTSEQGVAVYAGSGIATGSINALPDTSLTLARNGTFVPWPIRPTAATMVGGVVYFYIDTANISTLAKVDNVASLNCGRPTLQYFSGISQTNASEAVWVSNITQAQALDFGCSVHAVMGVRVLCLSPLESQNSSIPNSPQRNSVAYFELKHPWSLADTNVVTLFSSAWSAPIVSLTWHPETNSANSVWFSYVPLIDGVTEAMPHTLNLPTFNLLEFQYQ